MPTYGFIEKFSGRGEDFDAYVERLGHYLDANELSEVRRSGDNDAEVRDRENKRKSILLSVIGGDTYSLLRTLCAPTRPGEKSFDDLITILRNHFSPTPSAIVCRFKFHTRVRQTGESVASYMSELRKLAEYCNFDNYLTDMLRDRLVCGIADERVQRLLLTEKDLTLDKAYTICLAEEVATRDTSVLKGEQVNEIQQKKPHISKPSTKKPNGRYCFRCGDKSHIAPKCKHINTTCSYCKKVGHLQKMCLKKKRKTQAHSIEEEPEEEELPCATINEERVHSTSASHPPLTVSVTLGNATVPFQIDTGSGVSIMNHHQFTDLFGRQSLIPANVRLTSYSGDRIKVLGKFEVEARIKDQCKKLPLIIVEGEGAPLLGREWLQSMKLPWREVFANINNVNTTDAEMLIDEHSELFRENTGKMKGFQAKIEVDSDANPIFCRSRLVPFAMKKKIQDELSKLESEGIIEKVVHSDWAAPLVPVIKPSGKLRLCGDYKVTLNKVIKENAYPLPRIDELFASLNGGVVFSKLDLSQAYHQIPLDEQSRIYTTVNTPCGLYQYTRLPYGVSSAVGIFQSTIENLLKDLPGVCVYLDDILVTGNTNEQHLQNLRAVLSRLEESGLTLRKEKCSFFLDEVEYLGFKVTTAGLKPTEEKVKAVKNAAAPKNLQELRSFIGAVNYYSKFLPNLAHHMAPLYKLLQKNVQFKWTKVQEDAFRQIKELLSEETLLAHYNPEAELILTCDASPFGLGSVLQQKNANGSIQPIAFVSRTLSKPERNYAQIEREALSIVFGAEKFRHYLLGRKFTLQTDHKPLLVLFGEQNGIPQMASTRIKRWAMKLSAFDYAIQYIPSKANACADFLSRSPIPGNEPAYKQDDLVLSIERDCVPVTARVVASETTKDKVLSQVKQLTLSGWPLFNKDDELQPYFQRRTELSVEQDCVLWGTRVVIPSSLRPTLLLDLHSEHMGIVRMKAMARQYLWWPKLNKEIEEMAQRCEACREQDPMPSNTSTASWNWPSGPWRRLHLDFAGPFMDQMFLIVVDAHSKWLEVFPMKSATSETTIQALRRLFSQFGLPEHIVTDNGSQFTSAQFKKYLERNNIRHTCSAPGHPATNGTAERYVGYFKHQMKKMSNLSISVEEKLARFLLSYRTTPHPSTNEAPSVVLMKRQLRTRLSAVQPNLQLRKETEVFEKNVHTPKFGIGDPVYVLNLRNGPRWIPGTIVDVLNRSYSVQMGDIVTKRHEDQLRPRSISKTQNSALVNPLDNLTKPVQLLPKENSTPSVPETKPMEGQNTLDIPIPDTPVVDTRNTPPIDVEPRRNPTRTRQKPKRYRED